MNAVLRFAPMDAVGPREITRILSITDELRLHREGVMIPLGTEGEGKVTLNGNKVEIVAPTGDFEAWLGGLADQLRSMDLSAVPKAD